MMTENGEGGEKRREGGRKKEGGGKSLRNSRERERDRKPASLRDRIQCVCVFGD